MSSFFGSGPPVCSYHVGALCFGSKAAVIAWACIVVVVPVLALIAHWRRA